MSLRVDILTLKSVALLFTNIKYILYKSSVSRRGRELIDHIHTYTHTPYKKMKTCSL